MNRGARSVTVKVQEAKATRAVLSIEFGAYSMLGANGLNQELPTCVADVSLPLNSPECRPQRDDHAHHR